MIKYSIKKRESDETILKDINSRELAYQILDILKKDSPKYKNYEVYFKTIEK